MSEQLIAEVSVAEGDGRIVRLVGELDLATYQRAAAALEFGSRQAGAGGLIIDLSGLRFIDAAGVGALVRTHNWAVAAGVPMTVRGAGGLVARVLGLCGLIDVAEPITSAAEQVTLRRPGATGQAP
jgi:anti-anti-sigma factor